MNRVEILSLRPNNWFLNRDKLERIRQVWLEGNEAALPPVSVAVIDGELSLLDGHCRAFVSWEHGKREIEAIFVEIDQPERPGRFLEYFHKLGPSVGIRRVRDLRIA